MYACASIYMYNIITIYNKSYITYFTHNIYLNVTLHHILKIPFLLIFNNNLTSAFDSQKIPPSTNSQLKFLITIPNTKSDLTAIPYIKLSSKD